MKRVFALGTVSVSLALSMLGAGCGGSVAAEAPTATAEGVAVRAPLAVATHGHVKVVAEAIADVPLRSDQRAQIEKLATEADGRQVAVRAARHDLMLALADQVAGGQIDRTSLQPKIDAIGAAALGAQAGDRAALTQLHSILDSSQRSLFVDALESKFQDHGFAHMHMGGGAWKDRWAELNLTDAQVDQIQGVLHDTFAAHHGDWKAGMDHGHKTLEAFRGDSFAIDQIAPAMDVQAKTTEMSGRFIDIAQRVLPILTPEQRAVAAQKIHSHATAADGEEKAGDPLF